MVARLPHTQEDPGLTPGRGSYLRQVFFTLIAYVDPVLIGYLDVRRLVSRILGTWRRCGVEDNVSYVHGLAQPVVIIHHPHISTASVSKYRPTCICSQYLVSLGLAWAERGMGASYI